MKNKLTDLNDHLFRQLERLNDESLNGDELQGEISRAKAITDVSKHIVENASLQLEAIKLHAEYKGLREGDIPVALLGADK